MIRELKTMDSLASRLNQRQLKTKDWALRLREVHWNRVRRENQDRRELIWKGFRGYGFVNLPPYFSRHK